jgi:hypothetical protein
MKIIAACVIILLLSSIGLAENKYIIEAAVGVPFTEGYEFALKGSYRLNPIITLSLAAGIVDNIEFDFPNNRICYIPPLDGYYEYSEITKTVYYAAPSIGIHTRIARFSFGLLFPDKEYSSSQFGYPFDESKKSEPVLGIELGERDFYFFGKSLASIPLYSGGGPLEIGIGGRTAKGYEHKFFYSMMAADPGPYISFGYRGEYRLYKANALVLGVTFYSAIVGIKAEF